MPEHTKGKLFVESQSGGWIGIHDEGGCCIAVMDHTDRETSDARRLVAAWNFVEGWSTEWLEGGRPPRGGAD